MSYTFALVNTLTEASNRAHLNKNDWHPTLFIENPDVGAMDFTLSREKKIALIRNGKKGAEKYFEWFNNPKAKDRPINKYILANPR